MPTHTRLAWVMALMLLAESASPTDARPHRSGWIRGAFVATHPCPSTGEVGRACPGYVVDHAEPLCAGGADATSNMEWQEARLARKKDRLERDVCRAIEGRFHEMATHRIRAPRRCDRGRPRRLVPVSRREAGRAHLSASRAVQIIRGGSGQCRSARIAGPISHAMLSAKQEVGACR